MGSPWSITAEGGGTARRAGARRGGGTRGGGTGWHHRAGPTSAAPPRPHPAPLPSRLAPREPGLRAALVYPCRMLRPPVRARRLRLSAAPGLVALVLVLAATACATACGGPAQEGGRPGAGPVAVQAVTVEPRRLPRVIEAVGSLESPEPTVVSARVAGEVVAVDVPEGARVEAGHVLVRLDDEEVRAAIRAAEARREVARQTLRRTRRLHDEGVTSDQALDDARAAFEEAAAAVAEARARLRYTEVRAPFDGRLGLRQVGLGDVLAPGTPIVEMTPAADALEVRFFVPQAQASRLAPGLPVHGRVGPCGPRFEARVTAQAARLDPSSRTLAAEARITRAPEDGALAPGMGVRLRILVETRENALVVPRAAVVRRGTRRLLWVLGDDDTAQPREVRLGALFPDGVHVVHGLAPGDRVVAAGQIKLRPGAATAPQPWEPTANPNLELGRFGPPGECGPFAPDVDADAGPDAGADSGDADG